MSLSYVFSLAFFIAFAIYFILGIYIISINTKSILNRLFTAVCISLCIWAFSFSIANSAPDYETAIFWRRLASFGWGTAYSFLLHFFLILTERKKILKNKWLYVLIYLPAVVNVLAFGFSGSASEHYNLINTPTGWINVSANTWGDLYFNIYYISSCIAGLYLLWNWKKNSKDIAKKKQAYVLITSYLITIILATMTDVIVNNNTSFKIPQVAPIITLLPIMAIFYAIKQYGLMSCKKSEGAVPGKILSEVNLDKFILIMSLVFIIGGFLNFAARYFFYETHTNLNSVLLLSLMFFIIGIILLIIQQVPIKTYHQETFFILLMLVTVIVFTINYIETASITVWATPFIIVMLSVLFNKRRMIFWMGVSILATQIYIWMKAPIEMVQVDGSDYFGRIGIFSITLWIAHFVNRVYIQRLEENEDQIKFQKMVLQISADFVKVTESNKDEKINEMLGLSGNHFQVDRTFFMSLSNNLKTYEWHNEGFEPVINMMTPLTEEAFPWWMNEVLKNDLVNITDVEMMPSEAKAEKVLLKYHKIKSMFSIAVKNKDKTLGFLFFASVKEVKTLKENQRELLKILANLLSDALVKIEAEKKISFMAYYDALTGLSNYTLFKNLLEEEIYLAKQTEKLIGVIFIDLDAFKSVNDTIGHLGGDEMLKQVASRLSGCLSKHDTISRFGGDEFLIKITQITNVEDVIKIADKIMKSFDQPVTVKAQEFFVTASAGIAVYPADGKDTEELIKNADLAMYASKDKGKNQYTLCSLAMKEDVMKKTQLTNSLYRALERNELVLYYQPQVSVLTKKIVGLEALLRWNNPDFGLISPATFIPLAEQTGLIIPIGQWVLETACRQNKEWQVMGLPPLRMAVNLSIGQFRDRKLISSVDRILKETGLESKYLELEITESTTVDGEDYIIHELFELKELGVSISIDDFGTEYSTLSRLKTLPVDRIKIDMQFVHGISEGNKDEAIAKTIIQLAKNLKLNVIAEGVETESQFNFFENYMCDEIQGYLFYKPLPASEIEAILFNQVKQLE